MKKVELKRLIRDIRQKRISESSAFTQIRDLAFLDMGFAKLDMHRSLRKGFPEVVYAKGKTKDQLSAIVKKLIKHDGSLLITRADSSVYKSLKAEYPQIEFNSLAGIIYYNKEEPRKKPGWVTVVTAGTSDLAVAEEACVVLDVMGNKVRRLYDVGVAGVHRVIGKKSLLKNSRVVIVVAGMEGALASVVGGLVDKPVIAVPTSVGYGASFKGIAPLLTMLNSCAPGVAVMNIDNGFGAAYFANMIK